MDEPVAANYAMRTQMICVILELLRFVTWIIVLMAR